jgi:WbqC-like protein family
MKIAKKIAILQSNYIPWKGYFDLIRSVDCFVIYDDVQYTRRDWRNRNLIKTPNGLKWLTIPIEVKGRYHQKINEAKIADKNWHQRHLNILRQNYKKAIAFDQVFPWIERLYNNCDFDLLTEVNQYFLENIIDYLGIEVEIIRSEKFGHVIGKTERLLDICKELKATTYISGPSAKAYIEEQKFKEIGIELMFFDYSNHIHYPQLYGNFKHNVCIWDMMLNNGNKSDEVLKSCSDVRGIKEKTYF